MIETKIILATETLPRTKYCYQGRLVLTKMTKEGGSFEYTTHEQLIPDDRDDNTPFTINGHYYDDLEEAIHGFLKRKNDSCEYEKLKLVAE